MLKTPPGIDDHDEVASLTAAARRRSRKPVLLALLLVASLGAAAAIAVGPKAGHEAAAAGAPAAAAAPAASGGSPQPALRPRPKVVVALRPGEAPPAAASDSPASASRPQSDAEVRSELAAFRQHLSGTTASTGPVAQVKADGTAVAPADAPAVVRQVIAAANAIASTPYKWGGGHGGWRDNGYDCSGSVSFALAGAGLLDAPLTSGGFMNWGKPGPGRWITIYTNPGHMFMVVAGLRFDTSGANGGTRWQAASRSTSGLQQRHLPGL